MANRLSIQACIFDLDGVIVDTAKYHFVAWRRLANELGFDFSEERNEQLKGVSRVDSLNLILEWGGKTLSDDEKADWAARKNDWYLELIKAMQPDEILPGVVPFLEDLRDRGIRIALGSASKNARTILTQVGILDRFDALVDGNEVTHGKPHPETFLKGAAALDAAPGETIVFEDAVKGVKAANTGGFYSVGVGSPEVLHEAIIVIPGFEGLTPDEVFDRLQRAADRVL